MSINYTEKRNFIRMPIYHALTFKLPDSQSIEPGMCKNLSSDGISFLSETKVDLGAVIDVNITPGKTIVSPLNASVEIVRVTNILETNSYEIAGIIRKMN